MSAQTILVVEDNPLTRKMLRLTLESEGYSVLEAGNRTEALAAAAASRLDLVVLDYVLPDTDGLRLLAEVRREAAAPELPALVVTGMVSRLEELRARAGTFAQVLPKPIESPQLLEFVRAHLAGHEGRGGGRSVLVIDDEPLNLKLTALRLEHFGYHVETASEAREGLEKARRLPPNVILSDVLMPSMDGFAFCLEARSDPRVAAVPIVLVSSAYIEEADRELARKVGANALVVRTPEMREAIEAVEQTLRQPVASPPESAHVVEALHRERLQVQLERQTARNEVLVRQAAIQATALSVVRGLSEALAQPHDAAKIIGDVLVHCLDATGLSTGLLYLTSPGGQPTLQAQFGIPVERRPEAEACFGHAELVRRIAESGQPLAFSYGSAGADVESHEFASRLGQASVLFVPFLVLGQSFGILVLASDTHNLSESAWLGFARSLAAQFGQTVALGQSLQRLAESEARYRALMEQANDAIFVLNPEGLILEANHQSERLLALPRDQVIGRHISEFAPVPVAETPENVRQFEQTVAAGRGRNDNVVLRRGDGALVEVDFSVSMNEIGGKAYALSIGRDVTERNRAAAALRQAQQRLEHVVSSSPAVLFQLKVEAQWFAVAWVSRNVERLLGYSVEDVNAEWWETHLHPEDHDRVVDDIRAIFTEGHVEQEYRFRNKDGEYRWLRAELRLLRDAAGSPVEAIGSWADVSARKEAELALQQSEEQYRLMFDSNPHPMYVFDAETLGFLAVNEAAIHHYGYSREEFLGMTVEDIRPPEDVPALMRSIAAAEAAHAPSQSLGLFKHRKKDGTVFQVEIAASRIRLPGWKAWLVLAVDVTEKRSLEAQLLQAQKMESIGRLAGGVAHDFNNLLGVISGYGELLQRRVAGDPRLAKYADDIVKAAQRAAGLTGQLLAFSRKQVLQPRILDLNAVVAELEKMLRRLIGEDVQFVTIFDDRLGLVKADPGQLEQVLMNLAVNARDAMPKGGRLTIETDNVELDEAYADQHPGVVPGRYVMLAVSDTGQGMAPEVQAHAFEPFFTTKELGKGTGLGLAMVHGIVKQSGGHIWVYSEPGQGTTFKIYLPRADEALEPAQPAEAAEVPGGSETVLVVEDEAALRELIRDCLETSGYGVLEANDGAQALEIGERHTGPIHLLITDVVMPRMSGRELATRLRELRPEMRVLYMSGYTDDAVVLHGVLAADMAFLQKPFTAVGLAQKVRAVLDEAR